MVLRMVRIQPPMEVITMVRAGRMPCQMALPTNSHERLICSPMSYPNTLGNHVSTVANTSTNRSATQKYGKAEMTTKTVGRMPSSQPPRRQALTMPTSVPSTKAITVETPTRPSVQKSPYMIDWLTESGKYESEVPRLRWTVFQMYSPYCCRTLSLV